MGNLSVCFGERAKAALCAAFDAAHHTVEAEYYSLRDGDVIQSLNRAAARGVRVTVTLEGDVNRFAGEAAPEPADSRLRRGLDERINVVISRQPHALVHGKAAVVDGSVALVSTANLRRSAFHAPGDVLVIDRQRGDVAAVEEKLRAAEHGLQPVDDLRPAIEELLDAPVDLRIASEDLSDVAVMKRLMHRAYQGRHDRVLVGNLSSKHAIATIKALRTAGVAVRVLTKQYMHEKYVDAGSLVYVGSANLSRYGLDCAYEVGIVADAEELGPGAVALRERFDALWSGAVPWKPSARPVL